MNDFKQFPLSCLIISFTFPQSFASICNNSILSALFLGRIAPMPVNEVAVVNVYGSLSFGYSKIGASEVFYLARLPQVCTLYSIQNHFTCSINCKGSAVFAKAGINFG